MRLSALLLTLAVAAAPAMAAEYRVNGGVAMNLGGGATTVDDYDISGAAAVSGSAFMLDDNGATTFSGSASSLAGPAGLGTFVEVSTLESMDAGPVARQSAGLASASMAFSDVVLSGGAAGSFTTTSINADLDGLLAGSATLNGIGRAQVSVVFIVDGVNVGGGFQVLTANNGGSTLSSSGSLVGWNGSGTITSPTFQARIGQAFEVELQLAVVADAQGPGNEFFFSHAVSDFSHTLTFARSGPVFNLAAGLTANSADAGIVNNVLAVPEPPAAWLALAGLALLRLRVRRR
jgi:hypothetical protein